MPSYMREAESLIFLVALRTDASNFLAVCPKLVAVVCAVVCESKASVAFLLSRELLSMKATRSERYLTSASLSALPPCPLFPPVFFMAPTRAQLRTSLYSTSASC